jgi:hypothetical protein
MNSMFTRRSQGVQQRVFYSVDTRQSISN